MSAQLDPLVPTIFWAVCQGPSLLGAEFVGGGGGGGVKLGQKIGGRVCRGLSWAEIFQGAQFVGVKLGQNFGKIPAVQGLFAGILPKRSPRSAGLIPGLCKWKSQYLRYFPAPRGPWLQMTGALTLKKLIFTQSPR